jgi:uncharacterized phosphosugar-binding protein
MRNVIARNPDAHTNRLMNGVDLYFQAIRELQERTIAAQRDVLVRVADAMAQTILRGGRIFVFGSGHSHLLAEEGYYRAGGLVPVVPILHPALMLHEDVVVGSQLERTAGLAQPLLDRYQPVAGEMLFIFSNSGVNQLPVEMALTGRNYGLVVVSLCSEAYARVAPLSPIGKRLSEVAHFALDNGGVPGDALVGLPGTNWRVGPSSTVVGALIWNCLVTEAALRLQECGVGAPVIASFNLPGAAQHNAAIWAKWQQRHP